MVQSPPGRCPVVPGYASVSGPVTGSGPGASARRYAAVGGSAAGPPGTAADPSRAEPSVPEARPASERRWRPMS
ncbi:hypothetical protein AB852_29215 [Streptomyces uncialis]|uniref:Uncharacterized protein n=1 Tax=Streptomyces uncialis TaxID=1048205 RepID=A0A1Q4V1K1_9ACTN|nr:hypothetical protein AB852_29215 [Streptomyces uncialis]